MNGGSVRVGRRSLKVSNLDKVLFPGEGITKGDLIDYYREIAGRMLPHLRGRPIAMERYPDGTRGERIFQKEVPSHFPRWIHRVRVRKEGGSLTHVLCEDAPSLVYLANQACITPHTWLARADDLERPDQLIFDLDPPGDAFDQARRAARVLRRLLEELDLPALVKTTGGKGLHVTVPLRRQGDFDEVRTFARAVADVLAARDPERLTTESRKAARRGRLYLDVMRNAFAQTAVPPYAVRAQPGATVATPLDWEELEDRTLASNRFTIGTIFRRLERDGDPWLAGRVRGRSLGPAHRRLEHLIGDEAPRVRTRTRAG